MRICASKWMVINLVFTNMLLAQLPHEMLRDCISYYNNGQYRLAHDKCRGLLQMPDINAVSYTHLTLPTTERV